MPKDELDRFDRQLLDLLQRDADISADKLGGLIGLSPSAVQRRIKRMKQSGVIQSIAAIVDPAILGNTTLFVVGLELERERAELIRRLRAWIADEDAVQQVYYVTGSWDVLLMVALPGISHFDSFMAKLLEENPNVRRFSTNVVLSTQKRGLFIPVEPK